ncbi:cation:proton antiporter [Kitasatospora sp. NBC_01539]|uniref:cation:proton antiporter n=1 Tax=Kitasatospora sp. NBC_01539 TaxID=2903577 RepID=UPI003860158C
MTLSLDTTTRLLVGLGLVLALSRGAGRVAGRLGQPPVLAEIAVGIALGPSLLGRLAPALHAQLFGPGTAAVFDGLAQIAVALYAFEIGSHLTETPTGERRGRSPVLLALVSLTVPAAAGLALAPRLHGREETAGPAAFTVFLVCALGVTAVPVLARILQDRAMEHTPVGRLSLAAAALGDGACWCLFAVALWLSGGIDTVRLALGLAGVAAAAAVARWRSGHRDRPVRPRRERSTVETLGAVCLAAAVSSALGLHALFGGLVLGLAWPAAPARDAAPGRAGGGSGAGTAALSGALLPCFFLGAGQQVDLGPRLATGGFLGLVLLLLVVSLAAKALACAVTGRWYGLGMRDSVRLGVLMNTKGLTEIVVLTAGHRAGLVGQTLFEALLVVALVSTMAAGPVLAVLDARDARDARRTHDDRRPGPYRQPQPQPQPQPRNGEAAAAEPATAAGAG